MPKLLKSERDWETEHDLDTLVRAEEIARDKKRMEKIKKLAEEKQANMARVSRKGLRS